MHDHYVQFDQKKAQQIIRDQAVRRRLTKECHFWFFRIYFPHYVKYEMADFHRDLFSLTEDQEIKTLVVEAFRGSGKTTIMGMSYAIWSILGVRQKKFVLLLAQTETQARQYLANIKKELESNALLRSDLGPFEEPNDEWRAVSIVLPKYGARIMVASIDKPVRGLRHGEHRPDLIICDDLEDLDTVKTLENRDKVYDWLMGDVIPLGDSDTQLVVIGTRLHEDSILMRLRKEIREGRMRGVAKSFPFLKEDETAMWPSKWKTKREIEAFKKTIPSARAWEREYMLNIIVADEQVVRPEWLQYYDSLPSGEYRYAALAVDPAISEKETADCTAIVSARVYGRKDNLRIYILPNPTNARMDFPKTVEMIKAASHALGSGKIWVEGVAYQKALIDQLRKQGYPAREYKPQGSDKRARLSHAAMLIQNGTVVFPKKNAKQLITQLTGFGTERHDDLADAFCILVLGIHEAEWKSRPGHYPLFSEKQLDAAYVDGVPIQGERRLGVVLGGAGRNQTAIVLRSENAAKILFVDSIEDPSIIAAKVIELAKAHNVPISCDSIFIDESGSGKDLCERMEALAKSELGFGARIGYGRAIDLDSLSDEYGGDWRRRPRPSHHPLEYRQRYGNNVGTAPLLEAERYADARSRSYWKLMEWLRGGKLIGRSAFEDLLPITYEEVSANKIKVIDKETLCEDGVDCAISDALMLTFVAEKRQPRSTYLQPPYEKPGLGWD